MMSTAGLTRFVCRTRERESLEVRVVQSSFGVMLGWLNGH